MAGYTRFDVTNQIADTNVINAAPLNGEFDAVEAAFNAVSGHRHDGTSTEGAPITVVGPAQDIVVTATVLRPKTDNTIDLGTSSLEFKDLWIDGTANIDSLVADTADINAGTIDATVIGGTTPAAVTTTSLVATTADINGGTVDNTTIGTSVPAAATVTTLTATSGTVDGSAITTAANTQTLTNKTVDLTNNIFVTTSAQLAAAITDETGTGAVVFAGSPALTGIPTAPTAVAGTNTTQVATTAHVFAERTNAATLTNKTINLANNTLTATSAQIAAAVTDETGTGSLVFSNSPTFTGNVNFSGSANFSGPTTQFTGTVVDFSGVSNLAGARASLGAVTIPQSGAGIGQFVPLAAAVSTNLVLPAGGTWAWYTLQRLTSTLGINASSAGISAGGATIATGGAGLDHTGWAWRIA